MKLNEAIRIPLKENLRGIVEVYHGDNYGTTRLEPRLMNNGNNQEGIGIYFSDQYKTAEFYGRHIVKATIDLSRFCSAREPVARLNSERDIKRLLHDMNGVDPESMFYLLTDFGIFVQEPEDVEPYHIDELYDFMKNEQVRNFQITMAETFNVVDFVRSWNRHVRIDGTYEKNSHNELWVAIINTDIKVERVQ